MAGAPAYSEYTYHCDLVQWGLTTETASIGFIRLLTVRK